MFEVPERVDFKKELDDSILETKNAFKALEDYPIWMRSLGVGYVNASRGLRVFREIKSINDELNIPASSKFKEFLALVKAPVVGFTTVFSRADDNSKQIAAAVSGEILGEMLQSGAREAAIKRHMARNKTSIKDIRKIVDPEVKHLSASLTSDLQRAFDRNLEIPESQLLELAMRLVD